jgi:membrane fusion protein, multidrug efflux system
MSPARTALLLALMGMLAGCRGGPDDDGEPERQPVETLVVRPGAFVEWIETTGTVEAPQDATLSAEAGGTVVGMVAEGRRVQRGQVVAQLDPGLAEAGVRQAEAAVADARALVTQTDDAFARQQPLLRDSIISPLEFEQVRAQRQQARAALQQAVAALQESRERLEQSRLRAPFAGVVERHEVRVGEQVTAGQEVVRVVGPGPVEVVAGLPERFAGDVAPGTRAMVDLNAYGLGRRDATIRFVGATVDPQSRTFTVRLPLADRSGGAIKADMIAQLRVVRRTLDGVLVLPLEAVLRDERGESVLLAEAAAAPGGGTVYVVRRRAVELGARSEQGVIIAQGLVAGDEVVVLGQDEVAAGDTVRVATRHPGTEAFRAAVARDTVGAGTR